LDRNVTAILGHRRKISHQQREELAAIIHLCGAGPATAFARRGFRLMPGERCGDHDVAAYVAQINAMKRKFLSLAPKSRVRGGSTVMFPHAAERQRSGELNKPIRAASESR
jgi:hypothetical protein